MATLETDIGLGRPFSSPEEELYIQLLRTYSVTTQQVNRVYAEAGLTQSQYNALRILRGSKTWRSCDEISSRMVAVDSDLTRILSTLKRRGLIDRQQAEHDRRAVLNRISPKGLAALAALDAKVDAIIVQVFGVLPASQISSTTRALARLASG